MANRRIYIIVVLALLGLISCDKQEAITCDINDNSPKYPQCVQEIINQALQNPSSNGVIRKYCYKGEVVYEISLFNVPDASASSFQSLDCEIICRGSSNLAGQSTGDYSDEFLNAIEFIETVWEDER